MEDEVHQVCPIVWWHVWDNEPYPAFNDSFYQSTDLLNCHSYATYSMLKHRFPEKTNFVPHSLPEDLFFPISKNEIQKRLEQLRALDNNIEIMVVLAKSSPIGVDTKEDFLAIKKIMEYKS